MPTSRFETIEPVLIAVQTRHPQSVLDVGAGYGIYGVHFRSILDGNPVTGRLLNNPATWQTRIDAFDIYPAYLQTPLAQYIYDDIIIGDIRNCMHLITRTYDFIMLGDVIEHVEKPDGIRVIGELYNKLNPGGFMVIITPNYKIQWHEGVGDNPHEAHLALWTYQEIQNIRGVGIIQARIIGQKLMAVINK